MRRHARVNRLCEVDKLRNNHNCMPYSPLSCIANKQSEKISDAKSTGTGIAGFVRTIIAVIKGEKDTQGKYTVGAFSFLLYCLFKIIGGIGMLTTMACGIADIVAIISWVAKGMEELKTLLYCVGLFLLLVLFFLYSVMIWGAANEIEKETDKNYVLAIFSGVVSLAALIATIIPFFQEGH